MVGANFAVHTPHEGLTVTLSSNEPHVMTELVCSFSSIYLALICFPANLFLCDLDECTKCFFPVLFGTKTSTEYYRVRPFTSKYAICFYQCALLFSYAIASVTCNNICSPSSSVEILFYFLLSGQTSDYHFARRLVLPRFSNHISSQLRFCNSGN